MFKTSLLAVLALSLALELFLTAHTFYDPAWLMASLGLSISKELVVVNQIVGWFLALVTLLIALAMFEVWKDRREGLTLSLLLGVWWIGIGFAIYFVGGGQMNLITDSIKGAVLCAVACGYWRRATLT